MNKNASNDNENKPRPLVVAVCLLMVAAVVIYGLHEKHQKSQALNPPTQSAPTQPEKIDGKIWATLDSIEEPLRKTDAALSQSPEAEKVLKDLGFDPKQVHPVTVTVKKEKTK